LKKIFLLLIVGLLVVTPITYAGSGYDFLKWVFEPAITGFATSENCFGDVENWGCENIVMNKKGRIKVELIEASAHLISDVYMDDPEEQLLIPNNLKNIGAVTEDEYDAGTSFSFFIRVHGDEGDYDHLSDSKFCMLEVLGINEYKLKFEDLPEGESDCDYNDVVLLVEIFEDDTECLLNEICDGKDNDCDGAIDEDLVKSCGIGIGICDYGTSICEDGEWSECNATEPDIEICNGLDDDCDGTVDENLVSICGSNIGACVEGEKICVNGEWGECGGTYVGPAEEICDGIDNDCNELVDDGIECECIDGQERACGSDVGECQSGIQICLLGQWGECNNEVGPAEEICDGKDNDCDGAIDENVVRPCGDYFIGVCERGQQICENGEWGVCMGAINPTIETCNGLDDDCDGLIDESLTEICGISDIGECSFGTRVCIDGEWNSCQGAINPSEEICDGRDNDCDGAIDEGLNCECVNGEERACGTGVGECREGTQICTDGEWGECIGAIKPSVEICDNKDNDCDGSADEGLNCNCLDGEEKNCGTNEGACVAGISICIDGEWGECIGEIGPAEEICDGKDNDCDGAIDENITRVCGIGVGECSFGVEICINGEWGACEGSIGPAEEKCNGLDDDCDGLVDNGIDCGCIDGQERACGTGVGECREGTQICVNGEWGACEGAVEPNIEVCDGVDNDCDGAIDENITMTCGDTDIGECEYGTAYCINGSFGNCIGVIYPVEEECDNGLDDDCDGAIDENCGKKSSGGGGGRSVITQQVSQHRSTSPKGRTALPKLTVEFVEIPDIVDIVDDNFKARAVITNVGDVEVENVEVKLDSTGPWKSDEVFDLGNLAVGRSEGVIFTLNSDLCTKKSPRENSFTVREFDTEVLAKGNNAVDADAHNLIIDVPKIAVSSANADYSVDNTMKTCFFINNFDKDKKEKVELEFELSDWKDDIIIDFIDHVKINANETLIKTQDYRIEKIPRPKEYNLRVNMYENGSVFTDAYNSGKAYNTVDLSEFEKVKPRFKDIILKFLGFIKG